MGLLRLKNIEKRYSSYWSLDVPLLEVRSGKVYAVCGSNGSGKTTLLNIMALLLKPDRGSVILGEEEIKLSSLNIHLHRRNISLVMQKGLLFKGSVEKNIEYGLKCRKTSSKKNLHIVSEYAEALGVTHLLKRGIDGLSGGEQQRVMLARALVLDVDFLLLDEIMAGVDKKYEFIVANLICEYARRRKKCVVMTTHDTEMAKSISDEIVNISNGRVSCERRRDDNIRKSA